jgi:hypothetical protein
VSRPLRWLVTASAVAAATGFTATPAGAAESPVRQLVKAYSPIVMLRAQEDPSCDTAEEQFEPTTVNVMLGNPRVNLVRPAEGDVPAISRPAPTAAEIAGLGARWHLDVPGDPLNAGCTYAKDFAALTAAGKAPPITYAHIAREKGVSGLVVQYWFFYYFNQFNDLHEGDWEGMQVAFDANSARRALAKGPYEIALFQHGGGEKADWEDDKVEKEGTHPIVYPAAGSHATFYDSAIYVENGQGGSGLGCDNTSEPLRRVDVRPVLIPTNPPPGSRFQWLTYDGHWGQKEKSYNNGPQGPTTKTQWREPFKWMDGLRQASPKLPNGLALGPAVTEAFCPAVATVSNWVNLEAQTRLGAVLIAVVLVLLVVAPIALTRWTPVDLTRLRERRAFGQLVRAARQLYGRHWRTFVPMGLTTIVIVGAVAGIGWLVSLATGAPDTGISISLPSIARSIGFAAAAAAVIAYVRDLERGDRAGFVLAYREMFERFWRLILGQLLASFLVLLMAATVIGIPFAIWKYIGWQFVQQEILFEDRSIREAFRGSSQVVRGHWWRTLRIAGFFWLLSVVAGPVLGFALIFANLSLTWINIIGSLVFALLAPYVAIGRTLLYFDLSAREAQEAAAAPKRRRWWSRQRPSPQPG